jgi:hypothetical protein
MSSTILYFDAFRLELTTDQLWHGHGRLKLTAKAFAVLRYLVLHPERVVSKTELFEAVWPSLAVSDWGFLHIPRKGIFQSSASDGLCDRQLRQLLHDRIDIDGSCWSPELIAPVEVYMLPGHRRDVFE